jgi:hypothetical protein
MERHATPSVFWLAKTNDSDGLTASFEERRKRYEHDVDACRTVPRRNPEGNKNSAFTHRPHHHDIVNQLSVISLCCCELRNTVAEKLESDQLKDFKRIEIAVQNAADMIQQLKAVVQDHGRTRTDISLESALNRAEAGDNFHTVSSRFLLRR